MTTSSKASLPLTHGMLAGLRLGFLRAMLRTPRALSSRLGKGPDHDVDAPLSADLRWLLRILSWDPIDYTEATPNELRASFHAVATSEMSGPWIDLQTEDIQVSSGDTNVPIRVYTPRYVQPACPLLFWMHGGGWVIGSIATHDRFCRQLCDATGAIIVAADYRLAPDAPFPAALEDVHAVWSWIHENAESLGADPARLALGGDSAGGQMTSVLCQQLPLHLRPALQVLCYAGADFTTVRQSRRDFGNGFLLDSALIDWFLEHYAGGKDWKDPRLSPLYGELTEQPPAIVITAGLDPLLDEGLAYRDRLEASGCSVQYLHVPAMIHGFITWGGALPEAQKAIELMASTIRDQL